MAMAGTDAHSGNPRPPPPRLSARAPIAAVAPSLNHASVTTTWSAALHGGCRPTSSSSTPPLGTIETRCGAADGPVGKSRTPLPQHTAPPLGAAMSHSSRRTQAAAGRGGVPRWLLRGVPPLSGMASSSRSFHDVLPCAFGATQRVLAPHASPAGWPSVSSSTARMHSVARVGVLGGESSATGSMGGTRASAGGAEAAAGFGGGTASSVGTSMSTWISTTGACCARCDEALGVWRKGGGASGCCTRTLLLAGSSAVALRGGG